MLLSQRLHARRLPDHSCYLRVAAWKPLGGAVDQKCDLSPLLIRRRSRYKKSGEFIAALSEKVYFRPTAYLRNLERRPLKASKLMPVRAKVVPPSGAVTPGMPPIRI